MEQEEQVVAVLPEVVEGKTVAEAEMSKEVTAVEAQAGQITIASQSDYESAAAFGRLIKQKSAQIIEFFAPMKKAAHEAHQNICAREKEMLAPLISAEKTVKQVMGDYVMEQERKRREEEERVKRLAEAEAEKKLQEAMALEASGKKDEAEAALMEADIVDGASSSIDWEITAVDDTKVPVDFAGMCIRPVDTKAIIKLIRASKGQIKIPGISYKSVAKLSFRK